METSDYIDQLDQLIVLREKARAKHLALESEYSKQWWIARNEARDALVRCEAEVEEAKAAIRQLIPGAHWRSYLAD